MIYLLFNIDNVQIPMGWSTSKVYSTSLYTSRVDNNDIILEYICYHSLVNSHSYTDLSNIFRVECYPVFDSWNPIVVRV